MLSVLHTANMLNYGKHFLRNEMLHPEKNRRHVTPHPATFLFPKMATVERSYCI